MNNYEKMLRLWQSWDVHTEVDIDRRLDNFRILFAYHSGKIENEAITWHDTREIFENGKALNFTGDPRALFEQRNQKLCYELLKGKIAAWEPLSIELILEIHRVLTEGTFDERRYVELGERPGAFKKHDYVTGRAEVGSLPEEVEGDLAALLTELADLPPGADLLKAGAYLHTRFEFIHPFRRQWPRGAHAAQLLPHDPQPPAHRDPRRGQGGLLRRVGAIRCGRGNTAHGGFPAQAT